MTLEPGLRIHMVGIGGVGMAGLAYHLARQGHCVSGCDAVQNHLLDWLGAAGVGVVVGHGEDHVKGSDLVVRTTAVPRAHPEIRQAEQLGIQVRQRGEVLADLVSRARAIAVCGTHGKTTTSALVAHILTRAGLRPSFCVGGEVPSLGAVAGEGGSDLFVVEADESDGTLVHYAPAITVITNIEYDHMEHFDSRASFLRCFETVAARTAGPVVCGIDDDATRKLAASLPEVLTYGVSGDADVTAGDVVHAAWGVEFDLLFRGESPGRIALPLPGLHNVQNALGAIAVALHLGLSRDVVASALSDFRLPRRRFEVVAEGRGVLVVSDYAHHPSEITALLAAARGLGRRRTLAVFQPHRYTRTLALREEFPPAFDGVDKLVLTPVYEASESPLAGGTTEDLAQAFRARGGVLPQVVESLEEAWEFLRNDLEEGDLLLVVGAGDVERIGAWASEELAG